MSAILNNPHGEKKPDPYNHGMGGSLGQLSSFPTPGQYFRNLTINQSIYCDITVDGAIGMPWAKA